MRKMILFFTAIAIGFTLAAQPPEGNANPGDFYGAKTTAEKAMPIVELPAKLAVTDSFSTKIKATVIDVCPKMGCWAKLAINDSMTAFVQMKDYAFFLPTAIKGKTVVVDGIVKIQTTSVEELRHYAEDAKKSKEQIAAITEEEKEINIMANGILVMK